jgi:hypothetical protein
MLGLVISFARQKENAMLTAKRTPRDWFHEAARCYIEKHQGCAWCGDSHQVFQSLHGKKVVYYCNACDFRTSYDPESDAYVTMPGEEMDKGHRKTMFEI